MFIYYGTTGKSESYKRIHISGYRFSGVFVLFESIKRKLNERLKLECRCSEKREKDKMVYFPKNKKRRRKRKMSQKNIFFFKDGEPFQGP